MPLRISVCPYRLLFRHPFGTSHGLRDGTDALFVRVEEDGTTGHGEITLPPYLHETVDGARQRLSAITRLRSWTAESLVNALDGLEALNQSPPARAGLHTALTDLIAKRHDRTAKDLLGIAGREDPLMVMTIGICTPEEALQRVRQLPHAALKIKVGDPLSINRIMAIVDATDSAILLDGNQGLQSVEEAAGLLRAIPAERLLGIEQPFTPLRDDLSRELRQRMGAVVYADESLQGLHDLERVSSCFDGVNIKLMKCGGLDKAQGIAERADELNLRVMLGCMSESSLGCTAMAQLASEAQIIDLDGPWLLRNDPWIGMSQAEGRLVMPKAMGIGAAPNASLEYIDL